jgi:hypothetical protein
MNPTVNCLGLAGSVDTSYTLKGTFVIPKPGFLSFLQRPDENTPAADSFAVAFKIEYPAQPIESVFASIVFIQDGTLIVAK